MNPQSPLESLLTNLKNDLKTKKTNSANLVIPHSLDAERAVLCSLLINQEAFEATISAGIKIEDFYHPSHAIIYSSMFNVYHSYKPINTVTVVDELIHMQKLDAIGGPSFIAHLESLFQTSTHIKTYIKIIKDKSILRKLIFTASQIAQNAYSQSQKISDIIEYAEHAILKIRNDSPQKEIIPINELVNSALEKIELLYDNQEEIIGLSSGFEEIDKITGGFQPGELTIIAARPSMGKTALTLNIATHISVHNQIPVALFSLEMNSEHLIYRILGAESRIEISRLRSGDINPEEFSDFVGATSFLSRSPLFIDDSATLSISDLRYKCRKMALQYNIKLIIVDYLQLMDGPSKIENKAIEVGEISKGLKSIARELKIPVIALSQLNRSVESRIDKRPLMSDLRESGAIEQDADIIIFLYREDYYTRENTPEDQIGITEILIAKNRNGPTGQTILKFLSNITKFVDSSDELFDHYEVDPEVITRYDYKDLEYKTPEFKHEKNFNYLQYLQNKG